MDEVGYMPKEITHWIVAMKTAERLGETAAGGSVISCPNALRLGAVFPDILYYSIGAKASYRSLAHKFHGSSGGDSYELLRQIAAAIPGSPYRSAFMAFLAGVVCHIRTDSVFHPLIYYLTGNYEDSDLRRRTHAVQGHRSLESLIDLYFCGGHRHLKDYSFRNYLTHIEIPLPHIWGRLSFKNGGDIEDRSLIAAMEAALRNFRIMQGLSRSRNLSRLLDAAAPYLSHTAQEIIALFYSPALDASLTRISGALAFRNPLTGDSEETTLSDLFTRAVESSLTLFKKIEAAMQNRDTLFLSEKGPPLSFDPTDHADGAHPLCFATEDFFTRNR
ncbi:MAG: zinc dependent phospholipase C family protein [Syntrophales bacterium]|nr:zinc dependent phospholipase C family protein [Syntrophales bacterium]